MSKSGEAWIISPEFALAQWSSTSSTNISGPIIEIAPMPVLSYSYGRQKLNQTETHAGTWLSALASSLVSSNNISNPVLLYQPVSTSMYVPDEEVQKGALPKNLLDALSKSKDQDPPGNLAACAGALCSFFVPLAPVRLAACEAGPSSKRPIKQGPRLSWDWDGNTMICI